MSNNNKTFIFIIGLISSMSVVAQNYSTPSNQNLQYQYYGQQSVQPSYITTQGQPSCQYHQQRQRFRPVRRLLSNFRRLGLGADWQSIATVPQDSAQRKIGRSVAKFTLHEGNRRIYNCSATMISPKHAMLNAHCIHFKNYIPGHAILTFDFEDGIPVSYTHLTLPTICSV